MPSLQVYELEGYRVTHAQKYPGPILSLDIAPDCSTLAVGQADGLLCLRKHSAPKAAAIGAGGASACLICNGKPVEMHEGVVHRAGSEVCRSDLCQGEHTAPGALQLSVQMGSSLVLRSWSAIVSPRSDSHRLCVQAGSTCLDCAPSPALSTCCSVQPCNLCVQAGPLHLWLVHPALPLQCPFCLCRWSSLKDA